MNSQALIRKGRYIDAVGLAVCVVLTLSVYAAGVAPVLNQHETYAANEAAYTTEQVHVTRLERSLESLQARLNAARRDADATTLNLQPLATAPLHVAKISKLATGSGLQINDIQTGAATPREYATAVPVHLAGTGTYTACTLFLNRLRQALPETSVQSFALTGHTNAASGEATFRMDLTWHATLGNSKAAPAGLRAKRDAEPDGTPHS